MRNVEIKVRCPDLDAVRARIRSDEAARFAWCRRQVDTYFRVAHGRLKLRQEDGQPEATLIAYHRADEAASRSSDYHLLPVSDGVTARGMVAETLGVLAVVDKRRELYLVGETRIHLDEVDGLGRFVELETVIRDQPVEDARLEHQRVVDWLGLDRYEVVPVSYSDLILRGS